MNQVNKPFHILLIESNDDVSSIVIRATSSIFPEANVSRINVIEEINSYTKEIKKLPRLILMASSRLSGNDTIINVRQLVEDPLVGRRPILLLEYSGAGKDIAKYYQQGIAAYHIKPETYGDWKTLIEVIREFWFVQARVPH